VLVFEERGKPEYPEKPLGTEKRTNNKLNPHMTRVPGIEPGTHWWGRAVSPGAPALPLPYWIILSFLRFIVVIFIIFLFVVVDQIG